MLEAVPLFHEQGYSFSVYEQNLSHHWDSGWIPFILAELEKNYLRLRNYLKKLICHYTEFQKSVDLVPVSISMSTLKKGSVLLLDNIGVSTENEIILLIKLWFPAFQGSQNISKVYHYGKGGILLFISNDGNNFFSIFD